ncbi:cupin domain-containing protein [Xanthomonas citri]|uniref:cupin domain-containing protein n=1 Tax=Xanthomonas citri TaxID=346 RepID=UPI000247CBDE|nr:cupin domain-containing protein [Xanthomonas citri]MBE0317139.1 cupin domain-containing protein [Xanthomonas citri pv. punicae]MDS0759716.1 cupin domain-containing protein [Xanthomonas citri pv. punicae]MDS0763492.1 cupin domain-containing protein [Xanthomonas citri pv. punicae]MDS0798264.1 cupin domain-containing protein [Xanthomonas citri pv. punicae]MDS0830893.1 cupin domain-containing protein [Xanthomonas citri pv. punicae]
MSDPTDALDASTPVAGIAALDAPPRTQHSSYPPVFAAQMGGRQKRALGEVFGLRNFGVNLTTLAPGARSALRHGHSQQDEFVYIVSGAPSLITNAGEQLLQPGMCVGFRAGDGDAHCLINRSQAVVTYLEVGDRSPGDCVTYPDDDLMLVPMADGQRAYRHKDGTPY